MTKDTRAGLSINHMVLGDGNERALMMHCTLSSARAMAPMAMAFENRLRRPPLTFQVMVKVAIGISMVICRIVSQKRPKLYRRPGPFDWAFLWRDRCIAIDVPDARAHQIRRFVRTCVCRSGLSTYAKTACIIRGRGARFCRGNQKQR